jgi:hypothetical protein
MVHTTKKRVQQKDKSFKDVDVVGYGGLAKGMKQVAWERGFYEAGMTYNGVNAVDLDAPANEEDDDELPLPNKADLPGLCGWMAGVADIIDYGERQKKAMESKSLLQVLLACRDFDSQPLRVIELVQSRGHVCIFSPKCHPELAWIEYCWGMAKKKFRRFNAELGLIKAKDLRPRIVKSLRHVQQSNVEAFERRSRRYRIIYMDGQSHQYAEIEKFVRAHKTHRNILDQESGFLAEQDGVAADDTFAKMGDFADTSDTDSDDLDFDPEDEE